MTTIDVSSVNPTNVALPTPSPLHTPASSTSSLPSTTNSKSAAKSRPSPTSNEDSAAPRKRARSEITPEERKEARAHRNRIAAQNSRDKRKAQFAALEARIDDLEAENRVLRAGTAYPLPMTVDSAEQRAAEAAREAENQALRERVRTLESAWEAIIRTFQTHGASAGLPTALPPPCPGQSSAPPPPSSTPSTPSPSPPPSTTTFPVLVPPTPVFSLDDASFPLSPAPTGGERLLSGGVPAAGGPMQTDEDFRALFGAGEDETIDEVAMDHLFREILAAPPTPASTAPSLMDGEAEVPGRDQSTADADVDVEREIQKLFDLIPVEATTLGLAMDDVLPLPNEEGSSTALELDLGAWESSIDLAQPVF
ncbi:hypothetical protein B0F90DRAFT_1822678 [Multifurca ochricompacta]|uniref:X-box-binding protein 1 n=1 Tax=Multifurca ochricompacta TaxID=376703 RepID=A0AAD4LWT6_9AGAM|nr:hypothetical protein B0F90DRAFT_1822678 [Multifurca ochricompacta]